MTISRVFLPPLFTFIRLFPGFAQSPAPTKPLAPPAEPRFAPVVQNRIKNAEFAQVLNTARPVKGPNLYSSEIGDNQFFTRVYACCNGPGDLTLEMCDCSVNYYISTGIYDLPTDFRLFKVGPFYEVDTAYVKTQEPGYLLTIKHHKGKQRLTTRYQIAFQSVKRLNR